MTEPVLELSFAGGIDQSTQDEWVDPRVAFTELVNVRQDKRGGASKRPGYRVLATMSSGLRVGSWRGMPLLFSGSSQPFLSTYSDTLGIPVTLGRACECVTSSTSVAATMGSDERATDAAYAGGVCAIAYTSSVRAVIAETGVELVSWSVSGVTKVEVAACSDRYLFAFFYRSADNEVDVYILDSEAGTPAWSTLYTISGAFLTGMMQACSLSDRVVLATTTNSGTNRLLAYSFDETGLLQSTAINTSSADPTTIAVDASTDGVVWIVWDFGSSPSGVMASAFDEDLVHIDSEFTAFSGSAQIAKLYVVALPDGSGFGGAAKIFMVHDNERPTTETQIVDVDGVGFGATALLNNFAPVTRPFYQGSTIYIGAFGGGVDADVDAQNKQQVCIVVDVGTNGPPMRPVANVWPGLAPFPTGTKVPALDAKNRIFPVVVRKRGTASTTSNSGALFGVELVRLDFGSLDRFETAEFAKMLYVNGGILSVSDGGDRVAESNVLLRPAPPEVAVDAGSGSGLTGSYRYVSTYETADAAGNWVVSGISDSSDVVNPSNKEVTIRLAPLTITGREEQRVRQVVYRTPAGAEPPFYRLTEVANEFEPLVGGDAIEFNDVLSSDSALQSRIKLYAPNLPGTIQGEALDRRAPPGLRHIEAYAGMLVGVYDETLVWSGQEVYGEAPWFSPQFEMPITGGGPFTGLKSQDGTLYLFKSNRIYSIAGTFPSDNGLSGGFGEPRSLACDVGCINARSLVVTSAGIFFQSARGIELLTRGGQVMWIGDAIRDTMAAYPSITSASLDEVNSLVRFTCAESVADGQVIGDGIEVFYDLTNQKWFTSIYAGGEAAQGASMVTVNGERHHSWIATDGTVRIEQDDCLDSTSWVTMRAVTSWVHIAGLQGEQFIDQVLLLARRHTAHGMTISLAFDYNDSFTSTQTFTDTQISALARQWLVKEITQTTNQSVRVKIEDSRPEDDDVLGSGRGATWIGLTFSGQPHSKVKRTSGAQRGGSL